MYTVLIIYIIKCIAYLCRANKNMSPGLQHVPALLHYMLFTQQNNLLSLYYVNLVFNTHHWVKIFIEMRTQNGRQRIWDHWDTVRVAFLKKCRPPPFQHLFACPSAPPQYGYQKRWILLWIQSKNSPKKLLSTNCCC